MILFRLISFGIRLMSAFVIVFILQIKFDGKTLEYYLVKRSKVFFVTKVLNQVSEDSIKTIRGVKTDPKAKNIQRKISSEILPKIEKWTQKIELPYETNKKKEQAKNQL